MKKNGKACVGCCRVEGTATIDERGQIVLPKDVRTRAGLKAGDRLAVATLNCGDAACCVCLLKTDALSGMLEEFLRPVAKAVLGGRKRK